MTCILQLLSLQSYNVSSLAVLIPGIPPAQVMELKEIRCRVRLQIERKSYIEIDKTNGVTEGRETFTWKMLNR